MGTVGARSVRKMLMALVTAGAVVLGVVTPVAAVDGGSGWAITSFAPERSVVAPGEAAIVVADVAPALGSGYTLGIYDSSGTLLTNCRRGSSCEAWVPVDPYASETVTAYVVYGWAPATPPSDAVASSSTTVSRSGWAITSFNADDSFVDPGYATVLTATVSPALGSGFTVGIYDGEGTLVGQCRRGSECDAGVTVPADTIRSFRAYVVDGWPPASGPPPRARTTSGAVIVSSIPEDEVLHSDAYVALIVGLSAKYVMTEEACLVLGQAVPIHTTVFSTPDVTSLCTTVGAARTLDYLAGVLGTAVVVALLVDLLTGPQPPPSAPECGLSDPDGECTQEPDFTEPTQQPDPEPQPDPGGAASGVLPPGNCITDPGLRQAFEDSMPEQYHHMATQYGTWGETFQAIVGRYGLSVSDSARSWNVHQIPHRGPHPVECHQWVLENMELADEVADGDVAVFLALFDQWVVQVVRADPTIVRLAYWECYR